MARSSTKRSTLRLPLTPRRPARAGWSEPDEIGAAAKQVRVVNRRETPVDTCELARFIIGKVLVREFAEGVVCGHIVETEAYPVGDPAGHAYRGMTGRNRTLFGERCHAYVYLAYGVSYMLNVS